MIDYKFSNFLLLSVQFNAQYSFLSTSGRKFLYRLRMLNHYHLSSLLVLKRLK